VPRAEALIDVMPVCPVCSMAFTPTRRRQGGGRPQIYCSPRCRSLDWVRGNGGKRTATVLRYDHKPESKERKARRSRLYTLRKHGWDEARFTRQLERQSYACAGCLQRIDEKTARIDHDHETGAVRGLLCDRCNWGLGHLRDSPATMRRLMAYLDRDIDRTIVSVTGAL